ncbi:MAG: GTP cyclohydrolase II [Flavobacteriales bacterium]
MEGKSTLLVSSRLPSVHGEFRMLAFDSGNPQMPHVVLSNLSENPAQPVLVRIHSECMTGDVFGSTRCDCGEQLQGAMKLIEAQGGMLIYLRQEGRGIGLVNKLHAYNLQDEGMDTFEANHALGFQSDERVYSAAIDILKQLGVSRIHLITNNPEKIEAFEASGIEVVSRVPIVIPARPENAEYLEAKKTQMGHLLHQ